MPPEVEIERAVPAARARTLLKRLKAGEKAFLAERHGDVRVQLGPVVREVPGLVRGLELLGMSCYRLGRWKEAIGHLEKFRELTSSTEMNAVLADCHRALGRWADVEDLWAEIGERSQNSEVVTEGRIVLAATKADRGELSAAIAILEQGWKRTKRPRPEQLRRAYFLGDLYDRAGKTALARDSFQWVAAHDPQLADVKARLSALS